MVKEYLREGITIRPPYAKVSLEYPRQTNAKYLINHITNLAIQTKNNHIANNKINATMTTIISSSNIVTTEELFRTFADNNSISIADETFDSISQLLSAYRNIDAEPYHHIKDEIVRLCNLTID